MRLGHGIQRANFNNGLCQVGVFEKSGGEARWQLDSKIFFMARTIIREIEINQNIGTVFDTLITPSLIKKWWFASHAIVIGEKHGLFAVTWGNDEDHPDYVSAARIAEFDRSKRLVLTDFHYLSKDGEIPFSAQLEVEFNVSLVADKSILKVVQSGFPDEPTADAFYAACSKGWDDTLLSLKKVIELRE
jgi:uncharacterized protein YndB with AHSA1/START domain